MRMLFPGFGYPLALLMGIGVLTGMLIFQTILLFDAPDTLAVDSHADVLVEVAEMYFAQEGEHRNTLHASVGDVIEFRNTGSIAHTVTIPALGVDEHLDPGAIVFVHADEALENTLVNCRYHVGHEARLSVR